MKDLKIEYRDGKLIELIVDGEKQGIDKLCELYLHHSAPGPAQLRLVRSYVSGSYASGGFASELGEPAPLMGESGCERLQTIEK